MYMYIGCSTWGYELASFPCYHKIPKYTIEVVHAGISSLKINVKGGGKKKKDINCVWRLRTAKGSKVVQGDLPHIPS